MTLAIRLSDASSAAPPRDDGVVALLQMSGFRLKTRRNDGDRFGRQRVERRARIPLAFFAALREKYPPTSLAAHLQIQPRRLGAVANAQFLEDVLQVELDDVLADPPPRHPLLRRTAPPRADGV